MKGLQKGTSALSQSVLAATVCSSICSLPARADATRSSHLGPSPFALTYRWAACSLSKQLVDNGESPFMPVEKVQWAKNKDIGFASLCFRPLWHCFPLQRTVQNLYRGPTRGGDNPGRSRTVY